MDLKLCEFENLTLASSVSYPGSDKSCLSYTEANSA